MPCASSPKQKDWCDSDGRYQRSAGIRVLHRLLDQMGQLQRPGGLEPIDRWCLTTADTLKEVLQLCVERLDRGGADLLDEAVVPIQQLTVVR